MSTLPGEEGLKSIVSGFTNLKIRPGCKLNPAALEPVKDQVSAKSETNWIFDLIVKLKKVEEHTPEVFVNVYGDKLEKLKEFIRVLEKLEHELKLEHKENEKLLEGLESEFSSVMTLCDQLNDKYEHLYDGADERFIFEDDISDSSDSSDSPDNSSTRSNLVVLLAASGMIKRLFRALDKLDERCSRLVSPERTVGNLGGKGLQTLDIGKEKVDYNKNNVPTPTKEDKEKKVIKIKSHDKLIEQLEMAQTSEIPVVMLFNAKRIKPSKEYLPNFYELPNQYRNFVGDIKFLRVDVKQAATEFEVSAYPTVLVLMPFSCTLRIVEELSIEQTVIVPAFVKALKTRLDKCLRKHCNKFK